MQVVRDLRSPETNVSPATAPRTKTGLDGITALLAWAALRHLIRKIPIDLRLRAYVGGTLAGQHPRP